MKRVCLPFVSVYYWYTIPVRLGSTKKSPINQDRTLLREHYMKMKKIIYLNQLSNACIGLPFYLSLGEVGIAFAIQGEEDYKVKLSPSSAIF